MIQLLCHVVCQLLNLFTDCFLSAVVLWDFCSLFVCKTCKLIIWNIHFWAENNFGMLGLTFDKFCLLALAVRLFTLLHQLLDRTYTCRFAENIYSLLSFKGSIWHLNWSARHDPAAQHSVIKLHLICFVIVETGPWEEVRGINSVLRLLLL